MERITAALQSKVMTAEQAAHLIKTGMTIGVSGFTSVGYPKAVPLALAASGHAKDLTLLAGASIGDEIDGALARAGLVSHRFAYQSNRDMRAAINRGEVQYADYHISHFPMNIGQGTGPHIHAAIIECTAVTEDGLIPTASAGSSDALVRAADLVIAEVNTTVPLGIAGMHDIFEIGKPPAAKMIPLTPPVNLLSAVIAGIMIGIWIGTIIKAGGSTGPVRFCTAPAADAAACILRIDRTRNARYPAR